MTDYKRVKYVQTDDGTVLYVSAGFCEKGTKLLTIKEGKRLYQEQAAGILRKSIPPDTKLYTVRRYKSPDSNRREFSILQFIVEWKTIRVHDITFLVARVLDKKVGKHGGIITSNSALDLIEYLSIKLYPGNTRINVFSHEEL